MRAATALLVPALLALALTVPGISLESFQHEDEWRNAVMVREMAARGPTLHPTLHGERYPDYPPLYFLAALVPAKLEGRVTPLGLRLPSVLGAVLVAFGTALLGLRLGSRRTGLMAGLLVSVLPLFLYEARRAMIDPLFSGLVMVAIALLAASGHEHEEPRGRRVARFALGCAFLTLAFLTKGPLATILLGLALAGGEGLRFVLVTAPEDRPREDRLLAHRAALVLLVSTVVATIWFVLAFWLGGEIFGLNLLKLQTWGRFAITEQHQKPFYYYLGTLPALLPALGFAVVEGVLQVRKSERMRLSTFAVGWFVLTIVFLSVSRTKRSYYPMPVYPAVALLAAAFFERKRFARETTLAFQVIAWLLGLAAALLALVSVMFHRESLGLPLALGCAIGAASLLIFRPRPAAALAFASAFVMAAVSQTALPARARQHGIHDLASKLRERGIAEIAISPGGAHRETFCWELAPSDTEGMPNILSTSNAAQPGPVLAWLAARPAGKRAVLVNKADARGQLDSLENRSLETIATEGDADDLIALVRR
jgi:4-amino-4-deoxy-L-arabinose transferase-like glycosyltransferase